MMTPRIRTRAIGPADQPEWQERLVERLQVFVGNWKGYSGTEQSGAQSFLQKLLDIYDASFKAGTVFEQHPVRIPVRGKRSQRSLFGDGEPEVAYETKRMDMYLPKVCVWEMKGPGEVDLQAHHDQLLGYWARMRPRYMVLCNFREFWIYDTNDEHGQLEPKLTLKLEELPTRWEALLFLRGEAPDLGARAERVTAEVASALGHLVRGAIRSSAQPERDRERIARVVLECVFAMFAEDTELIPAGMFTDTMRRAHEAGSPQPLWQLFDDFSKEGTSKKLNRLAPYVNGPLFDRDQPRIDLSKRQLEQLLRAARDFDWQDVRPEIFGTIFEQALEAVERHELGAHYTREADIERVVVPTIIEPWRERIANLRFPKEAEELIEQLKGFHVLDPACGCGDFLYVVYREMKRVEAGLAQKWAELQRKVAKRRSDLKPPPPGPWFSVRQLHGIEINGFAAFLARVVLWIGEHLANRELGLDEQTLPLKDLTDTIRQGDALFTPWPRPDGELAIVGNPPYLGVRKLRRELGDDYVERLFERYPDNRAADFVTYWFTVALDTLRPGERAGFVATNSIAQNESREASIDRIVAKGGSITDAWKSYPWPGEAAVHVSIVNWIMGPWEGLRTLDGEEVASISPALTSSRDVTVARHLAANEGLCFMGVTPGNDGFRPLGRGATCDPRGGPGVRPGDQAVPDRPRREPGDRAAADALDHRLRDDGEGGGRGVRRGHAARQEARLPDPEGEPPRGVARNWWRFVEARARAPRRDRRAEASHRHSVRWAQPRHLAPAGRHLLRPPAHGRGAERSPSTSASSSPHCTRGGPGARLDAQGRPPLHQHHHLRDLPVPAAEGRELRTPQGPADSRGGAGRRRRRRRSSGRAAPPAASASWGSPRSTTCSRRARTARWGAPGTRSTTRSRLLRVPEGNLARRRRDAARGCWS